MPHRSSPPSPQVESQLPVGKGLLLLTSILPSAAIPVALAALFDLYLDSWRWSSEPFHALVEGLGSTAAVMLSGAILILRRNGLVRPGYLWVATTLVGMGLLDGFHAGVHPGPEFVWLHSLATLVGGLTFTLVVVSDRISNHPAIQRAPYLMALASVAVGIASVTMPGFIPTMVDQDGFTLVSEAMNIIGGLGFLVAWAHFSWSPRYDSVRERLLLANHCLLFGVAGLLFHFSTLWDATWWLWHILRLIAYLVILWFFLRVFREDMELVRRNRDELLRAQGWLSGIIDNSPSLITLRDRRGQFVLVNKRFRDQFNLAQTDITGKGPTDILPQAVTAAMDCMAAEALVQGQTAEYEYTLDLPQGPRTFHSACFSVTNEADGLYGIGSIHTDITERKAVEERIQQLAHHDALTGLFNRFSLQDRLEQAMLSAQRDGHQLALLFIDLDRFKLINDTLGHHVGDALLVEVAQRLRHSVRESDIVARLGGDEFLVVLTGIDAALAAATLTADKILGRLGESYRIEGHEVHSSPSIGVSIYPTDGDAAAMLIKAADTAMYHAKEQGRNNVKFFTTVLAQPPSPAPI